MGTFSSWMDGHIYILYALTFSFYMYTIFFPNEIIQYFLGVMAIILVFVSFKKASKLFKILCIIFSLTGLLFFMYAEIPIVHIPLYMSSNMSLLVLLTVLPFMTSVVHAGRFDRRLNELIKGKVGNLGNLYIRSSMTTYLLTVFINISALTLSQEVLHSSLQNIPQKIRKVFISRTTLRALAVALIWSPTEIIVAITVDSTGISYLSLIPWLLLCSFIVISFDWFIGKQRFRSITIDYDEGIDQRINFKKLTVQIIKLVMALAIFLIVVVLIGSMLHLSFILSVSLVIPVFSICWALFLKRWKSFRVIGLRNWLERTNKMQNFVVLFLSLSLFSGGLKETSFQDVLKQPFFAFSDYPLMILIFIQAVFLLGGLIGVHAIATIGVLFEVIQPLNGVINPISIAIVVITSALATATVGAYGVTVTMTSAATQQNPYRITLNNLPFSLLFGAIGISIGYILL
ncbi:hypothetical protein J7E81_00550 [Bacillus sp. ISL-18]|uniref:hypothetical protein n=1 Tax=Bacillus sp. ISL-18 TaxID=2819118 RepID=UPI001BEBC490|nr:hypothetical protein [Bacillus sp. ISL-18]MBT2653735.1 hypothetical protein [Bacillus sp. ISL-18]